jgi:hypothetical protein
LSGAHSHALIVFVLAIAIAFVLACNSRDLYRDVLLELGELEYRMVNHSSCLCFT